MATHGHMTHRKVKQKILENGDLKRKMATLKEKWRLEKENGDLKRKMPT